MMTAMIAPSYAFDSAMCQMDTIRRRKILCFLYRSLDQAIGLYASHRVGNGYSCLHTSRRKEIACGCRTKSRSLLGQDRAKGLLLQLGTVGRRRSCSPGKARR